MKELLLSVHLFLCLCTSLWCVCVCVATPTTVNIAWQAQKLRNLVSWNLGIT